MPGVRAVRREQRGGVGRGHRLDASQGRGRHAAAGAHGRTVSVLDVGPTRRACGRSCASRSRTGCSPGEAARVFPDDGSPARGTAMTNPPTPATAGRLADAFSHHRFDEVLRDLAPDVRWVLPGQPTPRGPRRRRRGLPRLRRRAGGHYHDVPPLPPRAGGRRRRRGRGRRVRPTAGRGSRLVCDLYELVDGQLTVITSYAVELPRRDRGVTPCCGAGCSRPPRQPMTREQRALGPGWWRGGKRCGWRQVRRPGERRRPRRRSMPVPVARRRPARGAAAVHPAIRARGRARGRRGRAASGWS